MPMLEGRAHGLAQEVTAVRDQLERGFRRLTPEHRVVLVLHQGYLGMAVTGRQRSVLEIPVATFTNETASSRRRHARGAGGGRANACRDAGVPRMSANDIDRILDQWFEADALAHGAGRWCSTGPSQEFARHRPAGQELRATGESAGAASRRRR